MEALEEPLLQEYELPPEAVRVALEPAHTEGLFGETEASGSGLTVTVREAAAEHPLASVTVTS